MFGLPKTSELQRRIHKNALYEGAGIDTQTKRLIIDQIESIVWINKLAPGTINLAVGETVDEIEIFQVSLRQKDIDLSVLKAIDVAIPYHIIFILEFENKIRLCVSYKEINKTNGKVKLIGSYYQSEWLDLADFTFTIDGFDLDTTFAGFVRQIAKEELTQIDKSESIKQSIERDEEKKKLVKKISSLKQKMKRELQFNKKVELNKEVKKLQKELEALDG